MNNLETLLVESNTECPFCGHELSRGDILYQDNYRGETVCGYCKDKYEDEISAEEGVNGRLLK
jgi:transcription elongation factor Elf1